MKYILMDLWESFQAIQKRNLRDINRNIIYILKQPSNELSKLSKGEVQENCEQIPYTR